MIKTKTDKKSKINFENASKGICVVCNNPVLSGMRVCGKCRNPCTPVIHKIFEIKDSHATVDVKSSCCNADVITDNVRITCSEMCHEKFIEIMEEEYGKFKKVTDSETGMSYQVPTRDIIEKGITQQDLPVYPLWSEKKWKRVKVE